MAKYTVKMSCGHEQTVELYGKSSERERKIQYYQDCGLCKECYKKQIQKENQAMGLILNLDVYGFSSKDGKIKLILYFTGDSLSYKDKIKELGYIWGRCEQANNSPYVDSKDPMCWQKIINENELGTEVEKSKTLGQIKRKRGRYYTGEYLAAKKRQEEWQEEIKITQH